MINAWGCMSNKKISINSEIKTGAGGLPVNQSRKNIFLYKNGSRLIFDRIPKGRRWPRQPVAYPKEIGRRSGGLAGVGGAADAKKP